MRILVRYLLWILIAAIPLQGAAASFISCGIGIPLNLAAEISVTAQADGNEGGIASTHEEHCGEPEPDEHEGVHIKCSTCASCGTGAVAPPGVPRLALPRFLSSFSFIAPEPAMTAFVPATLERPPRHA